MVTCVSRADAEEVNRINVEILQDPRVDEEKYSHMMWVFSRPLVKTLLDDHKKFHAIAYGHETGVWAGQKWYVLARSHYVFLLKPCRDKIEHNIKDFKYPRWKSFHTLMGALQYMIDKEPYTTQAAPRPPPSQKVSAGVTGPAASLHSSTTPLPDDGPPSASQTARTPATIPDNVQTADSAPRNAQATTSVPRNVRIQPETPSKGKNVVRSNTPAPSSSGRPVVQVATLSSIEPISSVPNPRVGDWARNVCESFDRCMLPLVLTFSRQPASAGVPARGDGSASRPLSPFALSATGRGAATSGDLRRAGRPLA